MTQKIEGFTTPSDFILNKKKLATAWLKLKAIRLLQQWAKYILRSRMYSYYFVLEVEPQVENPLIAHVSRAVVHLWVLSTTINEARDIALRSLEADRWELTAEKEAYLPTPEQIDELEAEKLSNYQAAQSKGIHATFYYWHRSE
ncbi:MAG: hypothetical protein PHI97_03225 [Desulfobulbus sp.]|nr:hypothetical protein [Desulfobulbus sp.]